MELLQQEEVSKIHRSSGSFQMFNYLEDCKISDDDLDEIELVEFNASGKRLLTAKSGVGMQGSGKKTKGPMDLYLMKPETIVQRRKESKMRQMSIKDSDPEARVRTVQYIARFFYQAGIPFNAACLDSFKYMVEAIRRYGPNLKPPSYHELQVPLLKKELQLSNDMLEDHKKKWSKYGCSIMSDAWTDRRQRSIINFLVNCLAGILFVESVDASSYMKTWDRLYELLDALVERTGEKNVIQVVIDNGSNYVSVGKLLQAKRKNLFWTPCAAHCVDLILEDIGKLPNKELVRCKVTRFATTYLTLERVHKQKINLRKMFTSDEWVKSKFYKEAKGKRATDVVLMPSFWNEIVYALKVMGPLVGVLRLVDNEKKPTMGYIYEAMDRAKEAIQKAFDGNEEKYKNVFSLMDKRWENQLHHPLHAASHFLNPQFFYNDPSIATNKEIVKGLYDCIEKLIPNHDDQDKIIDQLHLYKEAEGMFVDPMVLRSKSKRAPAQWWSSYGMETPELMSLAI
ncbi:hypothetical protein SLEP1_g21152 [Rubroshorea leprosula]|uniref:DUF659 domain-containing protein n=1 Tax=Rubroshorea leprosula TaxID=152421 RepID=A0AAV5JEA6_9ROSI|nr:hypothetical protein SLEP1_g21152 [Rubroshorea leprosula]